MLNPRIKAALVVLAASAGLGACTSYGPYGGSGVSVGVGYGSPYGYGYGSPYGYGYGSPYGYGYGSPYGGYPYFGWYDGFYYPGAGYWVYDPNGGRHPITDRQGNYWRNMVDRALKARGGQTQAVALQENFSGFRAKAKTGATIPGVDLDAHARAQAQAQAGQGSPRQISETRRAANTERLQEMRAAREQARSERAQARSESQGSMRERIIERRRSRDGDN